MYQVIARKYRPQNFDQLVNQEHVKKTLANALAQGRVGHGYIFAGQRGTGKTTVARILAKCLNCEKGPSAAPDLTCSSCREIAAGNSLDVIEIDAASNRGIDDVRELRESVRYRPTRDRYKVFIIDEAHQITDAAFNALLKTLEEPPEWVVFMLCTTEAHKIPPTIASRCQNFTFRLVEFEQVVERMRSICAEEGIEAEPDALSLIALAGDGSIRDSLSTLDQAIASFGKTLRAADVRGLLGVVSARVFDEVAGALLEGDAARMLELVERLSDQGQNLQQFCGGLTRFFRNLLVARVSGAGSRLIAATAEERQRLGELAPQFSEEDLTRYLQLALNLYRDLQHMPHPRFHVEMGLVKMVHAGRIISIEQALAGKVPEARSQKPGAGSQEQEARSQKQEARSREREASRRTGEAVTPAETPAGPGDIRSRLVEALRQKGDPFTADALEHSAVEVNGAELVVSFQEADRFAVESAARRPDFQLLAAGVAGRNLKIRTAPAPPAQTNAPKNVSTSGLRERALAHPQVERFRSAFAGRVREVRNLKENDT